MDNKQVNYYSINPLYIMLFIAVCLLGAFINNAICPDEYSYILGVFVGAFSFAFFDRSIYSLTQKEFDSMFEEEKKKK